MKVAVSRVEQHCGDLALLIEVLGLPSADEATAVARACLGPGYPIPPRAQYLLEEVFEARQHVVGSRSAPRPAPEAACSRAVERHSKDDDDEPGC